MGGDLAGLPAEIKVRLGLIVNPIAGIGGRVGLKGSDSVEIQREALKRGAVPQAHLRAVKALEVLLPLQKNLELFAAPGVMGEDLARQLGFSPRVVGRLAGENTSAQDTVKTANAMAQIDVDLILFAGGDGTAHDVFTAVGTHVPALGIPAGVKIHSSVFATHPRLAGEIAAALLRGEKIHLDERVDPSMLPIGDGLTLVRKR